MIWAVFLPVWFLLVFGRKIDFGRFGFAYSFLVLVVVLVGLVFGFSKYAWFGLWSATELSSLAGSTGSLKAVRAARSSEGLGFASRRRNVL